MKFHLDDTIGALASPPGAAARGIIRISGPEAIAWIETCFEPANPARWKSARVAAAHAGTMRLPGLRSVIPVLVYLWPNHRSYTGQPLVEIHAPGSPPLLEAILAQACEWGVRPAAPGEFTARAFLAGRIDLMQAEAVLGVIDADNEQRLETALRQLAGGISGRLAGLRDELINLLADIEAGLDFVDEGIEFVSREAVCRRLEDSQNTLQTLEDDCASRIQSTGRRRIVLAGLPNAGKSTLFNALLQREAALVSSTAGTTRDYLRGEADWGGMAVELIDTPGCEEEPGEDVVDGIMRQAHQFRRDQCAGADLIVWCSACDRDGTQSPLEVELFDSVRRTGRPCVRVHTKADLDTRGVAASAIACGDSLNSAETAIAVSAKSGWGLTDFMAACVEALAGPNAESAELIGTTAARCRESLSHSRESLQRARATAETLAGDELVALEIRDALNHLGRILGDVYTDDVLDRVFSRFCIGK